MRIVNVPLESVPERYSADWNRWFPAEFKRLGVEFIDFTPASAAGGIIKTGEFLDVIGTNVFKTLQTGMLCDLASTFTEDDVLFFHDGWHPGAINVKYILQLIKCKARMAAYFHAGAYHDYDYLAWMGFGKWAKGFEQSLMQLFDVIFVSTQFHRDLLITRLGAEPSKIKVVGMPYLEVADRFESTCTVKKTQVVFPNRLAKDKGMETWNYLKSVPLDDWHIKFVETYPKSKFDKEFYYRTLRESMFSVSCSPMETFGIAIMESVFSGCFPLVPDTSAFSELYPEIFKYTGGAAGIRSKLRDALANPYQYTVALKDLRHQMKYNSSLAIERIVDGLRSA